MVAATSLKIIVAAKLIDVDNNPGVLKLANRIKDKKSWTIKICKNRALRLTGSLSIKSLDEKLGSEEATNQIGTKNNPTRMLKYRSKRPKEEIIGGDNNCSG